VIAVAERVREFYSLQRTKTRAAAVRERDGFVRALAFAKQRRDAADQLWGAGSRAEAMALARVAFANLIDAASHVLEGADEEERLAALKLKGPSLAVAKWALSDRALRSTDAASPAVAADEKLEADVTPEDEAQFFKLEGVHRAIYKDLEPLAQSRGVLLGRVVRRWGWTLSVVLVFIALYAWSQYKSPGIHARAEQTIPEFPAQNAIDGKPETEWLLQNLAKDPLVIDMHPPRHVTKIRLLNGHNRHFMDRGVRTFAIEIYDDGSLARTIEGNFARIEQNPRWLEWAVDFHEVDRVVFLVKSYHGAGAALAELEITEAPPSE
jgi:hypothetical protein